MTPRRRFRTVWAFHVSARRLSRTVWAKKNANCPKTDPPRATNIAPPRGPKINAKCFQNDPAWHPFCSPRGLKMKAKCLKNDPALAMRCPLYGARVLHMGANALKMTPRGQQTWHHPLIFRARSKNEGKMSHKWPRAGAALPFIIRARSKTEGKRFKKDPARATNIASSPSYFPRAV